MKGNQGTLRDDVELFAKEQKAVAFRNTSVSQDTTVDGDHGRIETRTVTVFHDIGWLQDSHQWPGLKSVVMVKSERETHGKKKTETRFYITSLTLLANAVGPMIRSHWMVESAPQAHEKGGSYELTDRAQAALKDEGRSFGVGFQERASNHSKLLR